MYYAVSMNPIRSIAFMTLGLTCIFALSAVFGAIALPSYFPLPVAKTSEESQFKTAATTPDTAPADDPAHLLFIGDIMLARGVEWNIAKYGIDYPLSDVTKLLSDPDLTIGNFEGTVRENSVQELDGFTFDTSPAIAQMVRDAGIDIVSLSNNHSDNYGSNGLASTRNILTGLGITTFGDPYESATRVAHVTVKNQHIAFIGFHAFGEDPESLQQTIASEHAQGNTVIVFAHWGNEYQFTPSAAQTDAAHLFVDAGADLVIGAHPHVIQSMETYHNVPIIYSLGNFLFDQDWSIPTTQGLVLSCDVAPESFVLGFTPISIVKSHVTIMDPDAAQTIRDEHSLPASLTIARSKAQTE